MIGMSQEEWQLIQSMRTFRAITPGMTPLVVMVARRPTGAFDTNAFIGNDVDALHLMVGADDLLRIAETRLEGMIGADRDAVAAAVAQVRVARVALGFVEQGEPQPDDVGTTT